MKKLFDRLLSKHRGFKEAKGFTLVEILIVIFISVLLILVLFSLYEWHSKVYSYQEATVRVTEGARLTLGQLHSKVSQAYRIIDSMTVLGQDFTTGTSTVILELPAIDEQGDVINAKWDYVVFDQQGQNLYEYIEPDNASVRVSRTLLLADSVTDFAFSFSNTDLDLAESLNVNLKLSVPGRDRTVSGEWDENIYLKNY